MCKKNDSTSFGIGIIAGVVGGIVAGLLLAPKKGEESCKDVKDAIQNFVETQSPNVVAAKNSAIKAIEVIRFKIDEQIKCVANAVKQDKMEKAKQLEESNSEYDI